MDSLANQKPTFGDPSNLSVEKLQELDTILALILALPIARNTYAQIIDGIPIRTPHSDDIKAHRSHLLKTIIVSDSAKPSDNALQQYDKIRTGFALNILRIDLKLAQAYQNALPGSREHRLRLVEIVAASLHAFAGTLYASSHPQTDIKPPKPREGYYWQFRITDHFYVDFYHTEYLLLEQYPFGLLNVVGYWAEAELLGGVLLFERGSSSSEVLNAFVHPQRANHAFQLSEKQLSSFSDLGIARGAARGIDSQTLLPFAKEHNARTEPTFERSGGTPLRIYKNDYDKQPIAYMVEEPSCVITQDDPRAASLENAMKFAEEHGLNRLPANPQTVPQNEHGQSLRRILGLADNAESSSKDDAPSASKKDH